MPLRPTEVARGVVECEGLFVCWGLLELWVYLCICAVGLEPWAGEVCLDAFPVIVLVMRVVVLTLIDPDAVIVTLPGVKVGTGGPVRTPLSTVGLST